MFHYGKAYSIIFSFTGSLMPRLPENYWLLGRSLPDLLAPSTSGKAELASDDILTSKSHLNKTLVRGDPYPNHPGADFAKQDRWELHWPVRIFCQSLYCIKLTITARAEYLGQAHDLSRLHEERKTE